MQSTARRILWFTLLSCSSLTAPPRALAHGGVPLWTNHYHGQTSGLANAVAMAVDNQGNIFVTGTTYGSTSPDYATVAYSNAGVPLWTNRYDGPDNAADLAHAIAAGKNGEVLVTGASSDDYATIAYSSAGQPLWTNRYTGPGNRPDSANAVVVDSVGRVFVTGSSGREESGSDCVTIAYSSAGVTLWANRFSDASGDAIALDEGGNVFVTGISLGNRVTLAYSQAGTPLWTNRSLGTTSFATFERIYVQSGIAVDKSGRVFVTGGAGINGSHNDYETIAYSNSGVPLWTNRYREQVSAYDYATAIALDSSGNVFVTGFSAGPFPNLYDYATVAYSATGAPLWTNRYNGPANYDDKATAIAVDANGNVFVTGYSAGANSSYDFATVAYSGAGVALWTNRHNGLGVRADKARAIAIDGSGNVFVAGDSWDGGYAEYTTIKYSSTPYIHLNHQLLNNHLVLSWPNPGFSLQAAPDSNSTFTNLPGATSPYTNLTSGSQQFFRLKSN